MIEQKTFTDTPPFEYIKAKKWADRVMELLSPHCDIIHIAGSIRRECTYVKDIEIVCIPKKVFEATDLFGGGELKISKGFIDTVEQMKESIVKGKFGGRYMQVILRGGIKMDLFTPEKEDYYRQLAIRTGSADYSFKVIANGWTNLGWCGTSIGLRRKSDCFAIRDKEGKKIVGWKCINNNGEHPPPWTSEESLFEWLGVRWVDPKYR